MLVTMVQRLGVVAHHLGAHRAFGGFVLHSQLLDRIARVAQERGSPERVLRLQYAYASRDIPIQLPSDDILRGAGDKAGHRSLTGAAPVTAVEDELNPGPDQLHRHAVPTDARHLRRRGEAGQEYRDRYQDAEYQHGLTQ